MRNWSNSKNTYSQHGEDLLIQSLSPDGIKSFIDIGANDGVLFSNTYKFAKNGATGLCIEPSSTAFRKLQLNHLFHPKVKCKKAAVSSNNQFLFLKHDGYEDTLSTVTTEQNDSHVKIKCFSFDFLLKIFPCFKKVDLLSVDVEGHEFEVFKGLNNKSFSAKFIIVETDKSIISSLLELSCLKEYFPLCSNGTNTILLNKNQKIDKSSISSLGFHLI